MSGYGPFARYYDALTANVDYVGRAAAFDQIIRKYWDGKKGAYEPGLVLDLACGTGALSLELANLGYDVIGADLSAAMLSVAAQKVSDRPGKNILFLNQGMEHLDLYGTVDAAICALDSINHIGDERGLLTAFQKVSLFTNPGGLFVFDVNTLYKHREALGCNAFVYDLPQVFCCWQNEFYPKTGRVDITLDFFAPSGDGNHTRETESFSEWFYSDEVLTETLKKSGFEHLETLDGDSFGPVSETSQRLMYVVRRLEGDAHRI